MTTTWYRFVALGVLLPLGAFANTAAVQREPGRIGLAPLAQTDVEITREDLLFDCVAAEQADPVIVRCRFDAAYHLRNPTDEARTVDAVFYGVRSREVRAFIADAALPTTVVEEGAGSSALEDLLEDVDQPIQRVGFTLRLEAGQRATLRVTGETESEKRFVPSGIYVIPAIEARHLWLAPRHRPEITDVEYLLAPLHTWAGDPEIHIKVVAPAGWSFGASEEPTWRDAPGAEGWKVVTEAGRALATRTFTARAAPRTLFLAFHRPASVFNRGGPLLAFGARVGPNASPRLRAGWQVAAPDYILYSLTAETDFGQQVVVSPMVQAASPHMIFIPSFGLGLGVPVQVSPRARLGMRGIVDAHFVSFGLVTTVDHYPADETDPALTQVSVMFQVGL